MKSLFQKRLKNILDIHNHLSLTKRSIRMLLIENA